MPEERDDAELVRSIGDGDTEALRALYERYGSIVFGMAYRLLGDRQAAEECTQDVFVAVWRAAGAYDPERARVSSWMIAIARNRVVDIGRGRLARPVEPYAELRQGDESPDAAELAAAADSSRRIAAALAELPAAQREALTLAYFHGLSHSEIAERLVVPLGTVKGRIRLALDRLRDLAPTYALDTERQE
ncbi:MAG: sigma-70 family RNA polymerase sigma factor [Gaiellaceae bacterium]